MSEEKKAPLTDETLEAVSGGMSDALKAAYAINRGEHGDTASQRAWCRRHNLNPDTVFQLAADLQQFEQVANAVVRGEYGNGSERMLRLTQAGYDPAVIQNLVNHMRWDPEKQRYM